MTKRVALYLRCSTAEQDTSNQRLALEEAARRHGWQIVAVYEDAGVSGSKGRDRRPGYDALLKAISRKEVDVVGAWAVDRLSRSLRDLVTFLEEIRSKEIDLFLLQSGLDTGTPAGRALFGMLSVFSELERSLITERVKAGLARARASGIRLGRQPLPPITRDKVIAQHLAKKTAPAIARSLDISVTSVRRVLRVWRKEQAAS